MCGTGRGWGGVGEWWASRLHQHLSEVPKLPCGERAARAVQKRGLWPNGQGVSSFCCLLLLLFAGAAREHRAKERGRRCSRWLRSGLAGLHVGLGSWQWPNGQGGQGLFSLRWGSGLRGAGGTVDGCAGGGGGGGRGRLEVGCGGRWRRASWRLRGRSAVARATSSILTPRPMFLTKLSDTPHRPKSNMG